MLPPTVMLAARCASANALDYASLRTARAEGLPTVTGEVLHAAAEVLRASRHRTAEVDGEPSSGLLDAVEVA